MRVDVGVFIAFEGPEGSGKSTQVRRLASRFAEAGRAVVSTREPGGTPLAEVIRDLILRPEAVLAHGMLPAVEALLFTAARADHVSRVIRPAIECGDVVLCDRYTGSTLAYQGGGRGLDMGQLVAAQVLATGGLMPDLTILLDLPVEIGLTRRIGDTAVSADINRLDKESIAFHQRVRACYLSLAAQESDRWVTVDAAQPVENVEQDVMAAITAHGLGTVD